MYTAQLSKHQLVLPLNVILFADRLTTVNKLNIGQHRSLDGLSMDPYYQYRNLNSTVIQGLINLWAWSQTNTCRRGFYQWNREQQQLSITSYNTVVNCCRHHNDLNLSHPRLLIFICVFTCACGWGKQRQGGVRCVCWGVYLPHAALIFL